MPWAAAIPLISAGLGAAGGALSNRKSSRTATNEFSQTGTSSGSSSNRRVLTPEQQQAMQLVSGANMQSLLNPAAAVDPMRMAARSQVNANYAGVEDVINAKYGTSGAKTGKRGTAGRAAELARLGQLSGVDRDSAEWALTERQRALQSLMQLLGMNFESESSFDSTDTRQGTGSSVGPGDPWGGMLSGGVGGLFAGNALHRLLNPPK